MSGWDKDRTILIRKELYIPRLRSWVGPVWSFNIYLSLAPGSGSPVWLIGYELVVFLFLLRTIFSAVEGGDGGVIGG